jgi:hypothetical protein
MIRQDLLPTTKEANWNGFVKAGITLDGQEGNCCELLVPNYCLLQAPFDITTPVHWTLTTLRCFIGESIQISVLMAIVDREVGAADLVETFIIRKGATILQKNETYGAEGRSADILSELEEGSEIHYCRSKTIKDNNRIFVIEGIAPKNVYLEKADEISLSLQSFHLVRGTPILTSEPLAKFSREKPYSVSFSYPASWQIFEAQDNGDKRIVYVSNDYQGITAGRIVIEVNCQKENLDVVKLFRSYADNLQEQGIRLSGSLIIPMQPTSNFNSAWIYSPKAVYQNQSVDSPAIVFEASRFLVLLGMTGASRQVSPEWWAINKRAFEIVRDSIRII